MQITSGLRSVISFPVVYKLIQKMVGSEKGRKEVYCNIVNIQVGDKVLDIGCGLGKILEYLPKDIQYWGYDISKKYIDFAREKYSDRAVFYNRNFTESELSILPKMDAVLMLGVLHHLSDEQASELIQLVYKVLKPNGRLITIDPVYAKGQNLIAKFLISLDRGRNIKREDGYVALHRKRFEEVTSLVRHKRMVPYTNCICISKK